MKQAYPNYAPDSLYTKPAYNLNKWLEAMRNIYTGVHFGHTFKEAFGAVAGSWDTVEQFDFKSWMNYYQSGSHTKYKSAKFANNFYVNENIPGYFIPNKVEPPPPIVPPDISQPLAIAQDSVKEITNKQERRQKIEEQRRKIIARLNAAVKHLTSSEGHMLAGEEFDNLLASLYEVIKQVQTVNKVSLSNTLYTDLIIRQANKLSKNGFSRSANILTKVAQNVSGNLDASGPLPIASADTGVAGGTLENPAVPLDAIAPPVLPDEETDKQDDIITSLLENLNTAGLTDINFSDEDELSEVSLDEGLEVEAQLIPPSNNLTHQDVASPMPKKLVPPPQSIAPPHIMPELPPDELEVEFDDKSDDSNDKIDDIIENALSSVTVNDVINKLDGVISVFRNRQLPRELTIIDMMLHQLGLASLFPELGESTQRILDSNSYVLSRLEKISSQLKGATTDGEFDLDKSPSAELDPHAKLIKDRIEKDQNKDKQNREQRRKQRDDDELEAEQRPIPQELMMPVQPQMKPQQEVMRTPPPQIV